MGNIKKKIHWLLPGAFLGILLVAMVWEILSADKTISMTERRKLAGMPEVTWETIKDGSFMSGVETYLLDQFPGREDLRKLMSLAERNLFLKADTNQYYCVGNGVYLLEYELDDNKIIRAAEKFTEIAEKLFSAASIYYAVIPDKNYYLAAENGYPSYDYERLFTLFRERMHKEDGIKEIDLLPYLSIEDYYLTDLHWNQSGITDVASYIAKEMGTEITSEYERVTALKDFYGGYASAGAIYRQPDELTYLIPKGMEDWVVYDYEKNSEVGVYPQEKIEGTDPYDVFLWGARALITIENPNQMNQKELVLFRDSFGSSIAPLLAQGYSKVTMIDLRYVSAEYALTLVTPSENCDVIFLYNTLLLNKSDTFR